jgi:hypothetical protein
MPQGGPRSTVSANVTGKGKANACTENLPRVSKLSAASWFLWLRRLPLPDLRQVLLRKVYVQRTFCSRLPALWQTVESQAGRLHALTQLKRHAAPRATDPAHSETLCAGLADHRTRFGLFAPPFRPPISPLWPSTLGRQSATLKTVKQHRTTEIRLTQQGQPCGSKAQPAVPRHNRRFQGTTGACRAHTGAPTAVSCT